MIDIGFTGSRKGMTKSQQRALYWILEPRNLGRFHHGDCVGADAEAHMIAEGHYRIIHPPDNDRYRAYCPRAHYDSVLPEKPYLVRNCDIINASDVLIAAPRCDETLRSGTWTTVRYARAKGIPAIVLDWK